MAKTWEISLLCLRPSTVCCRAALSFLKSGRPPSNSTIPLLRWGRCCRRHRFDENPELPQHLPHSVARHSFLRQPTSSYGGSYLLSPFRVRHRSGPVEERRRRIRGQRHASSLARVGLQVHRLGCEPFFELRAPLNTFYNSSCRCTGHHSKFTTRRLLAKQPLPLLQCS